MTETTMRAPNLLRAVFVVHGFITLAGAVVLTITVGLTPSGSGVGADGLLSPPAGCGRIIPTSWNWGFVSSRPATVPAAFHFNWVITNTASLPPRSGPVC